MRALILLTVLLLASCSSTSDDADASATEDAGPASDAGTSATDGGSTDAGSMDAGARDAGRRPDAGATIPDAGPRRDGGRPNSLCTPGPCTPTCFRPYVCVAECGGAETNCGCCPCAANAVDTIDCAGG